MTRFSGRVSGLLPDHPHDASRARIADCLVDLMRQRRYLGQPAPAHEHYSNPGYGYVPLRRQPPVGSDQDRVAGFDRSTDEFAVVQTREPGLLDGRNRVSGPSRRHARGGLLLGSLEHRGDLLASHGGELA